MKKLFKTSFILLALLGVMFTSCKKEYEIPPIPVLPEGDVYTIGDLLAMPANTSFDTASVYGIVTADEQSGNLYKTIFIQDRNTGKAIELLMNTSSAARIGDSVRVFLDKNIMVNNYHNLPQLVGKDGKGFSPDGHLIIYPYNKPIEPATVTIADIKTGNYTAGVVRLENVEFVEQGSAFCNVGENTNRTLKDATGELLVRTSNYANFAYDMLPAGPGSLVAIASVYNNDWQLIIRSKTEMKFEGGEPLPPTPAGEVQQVPYHQSFASDFGTYTTYDVMGDQSWMIDYSTAKMTGYVNSAYYANEDWLISSPVDLTTVNEATMTMSYIGRYFTNINEEVTVWGSTDYTFGSDPQEANWTQIPARLSEGTNWSDFLTAEIALVDVNGQSFAGKTATFAVKYTSSDSKAGTMEVQSITIAEGGSNPPTPQPSGEVQNMPYFQSFATEFGTYTTQDVMGAQSWMIDYSTAKMTGYVGGAYYANEDWLISSPVAITGVNDAKMTMVYIARYFTDVNDEVTIWASTDYVYGNEPSTGNWAQVPSTLREGTNWNDFLTAEISLTDYVGQTVIFAVRYTSTDQKAGTIEIQSITIEEGSGVTPGPTPTPGNPEGTGTAEDPYNVAAGIVNQGQENVWVHGYIVGAVKNGTSAVSSNDDIIWSGSFDSPTNVVIADDPTCNDVSLCVIVNLPAGKPLRAQVNLVDNPSNLGKMLSVRGKLRTYFGQAGLRDSNGTENDFSLEGAEPPTPTQSIFSESFASGQGDFAIEDVLLPQELTYVWAHSPDYSCMKASAYVGQAYETESWLVSPYIDLANVNTATLKFDQAVNYAQPQGALSVMITTEYVDTIDGIEWEELQLSAWPAGNNWTFVSSTADLTPYAGQRVTIAFKYTSTPNGAATWEVKNFVVE
ncbi:MAG: DUF5689 domain-containing protein [Bacteroidales bacterium]|nr:DUF5689 domain-containing protein [Bacteroidales bacterium]